jgi:hypothetical protein
MYVLYTMYLIYHMIYNIIIYHIISYMIIHMNKCIWYINRINFILFAYTQVTDVNVPTICWGIAKLIKYILCCTNFEKETIFAMTLILCPH